jgi:hypothetical protein
VQLDPGIHSRDFLFLLASAREGGHTEALARQAAVGLPLQDTQRWLRLSDLPLPIFHDTRHSAGGVQFGPTGHERTLLQATLQATDLVVVSPLYWYSLSAQAKLYLDYWAGWLRLPGTNFAARMRGKTLWAVSTFADSDLAAAQPLVDMLRLTADHLVMHWGGALLTTGHHSGASRGEAFSTLARAFFADRRATVP